MNFPKITDLVSYINKALNGNAWNTNFQKIVNWLSLGDTDIKVKSVEAETIKFNGNNIINNGNITATSVTANTITSNDFVGNGEHLENIKVSNVFAFTPFAINSAKANFIDITDTSKLVFLVDDGTLYKPLKITKADGTNITITSILDYDVSGLNGTYYIFADETTNGGTVFLKTCDIYIQSETPVGNNGDIWLDTSCQKYVVREKVSSNWYTNEYNKVPLAKVVISSGTITSLEMIPFNSNGVNVTVDSKYSNIMTKPILLVGFDYNETTKDFYKLYSNGWIEQGGRKLFTAGSSSATLSVAFVKEMKDKYYNVLLTYGSDSNDNSQTKIEYQNRSTTGFDIKVSKSNLAEGSVQWKIEGLIK